ncbi:glycosyltransferase family protein [Embleya sp. NPDC005575]|uniref:glycosyltransferase family protein n=1 Tax=Embleya sp. NPDC005575 TaxID=3156892 RepID=UPI0033A1807E
MLIGVNGIGMGHGVRQGELASLLRSRGHDVQIVTSGGAVTYFRDLGFTTWEGWLPRLIGTPARIPVRASIAANYRQMPAGVRRYAFIRDQLRKTGVPDVFVTDYEPNSAWLAYGFGRPVISVDQQSKYRHLDLPPLGTYRRAAERQRLRVFMPRVQRSFVCSFMPMHSSRSAVDVIPPILTKSIRTATPADSTLSVAYFSRYFEHGPQRAARALADFFRTSAPESRLRIYIRREDFAAVRPYSEANVEVRIFDRERFLSDLMACQAVFCNAGFNLIAEAFALGKPCYLVPLPTYDQHWCAHTVNRRGFGEGAATIEPGRVAEFLGRRAEYAVRINAELAEFLAEDPVERIATHLESLASSRRAFSMGR